MRKAIVLSLLLLALGAGNVLAVIGWAGNVWPNSGAIVTPTAPVDVYAQVWKGGVTDQAGQGAGIEALLYYTTDIAPQATVPMVYNTDVGNNDEYTGQIPQAALVGASYVDVTVIFHDLDDDTYFEVAGDQAGNAPPLRYTISNVLPNDVSVTFTLCLSGEVTGGDVCVIGSAAELGGWTSGVTMNNVAGDLYDVTVVFPAGSNPYFEYKYRKDGCDTWESVANRVVTLPTDGTTAVVLGVDSWNNLPLGCGLGEVLGSDKTVCFQVCLEGVENSGGVCVIGSVAELTNWSVGVPMVEIGPALWQACVTFPQGTPIPLNVEYKYKKDDCQTWESVPNRVVTVDNTLPPETTLTNSWDDGPSVCEPVANENEAWGTLKSMYR